MGLSSLKFVSGCLFFLECDAYNFETGYLDTDVNGDGNVDSIDLGIIDNNLFNFVSRQRFRENYMLFLRTFFQFLQFLQEP